MKIEVGSAVRLHYTLMLSDGHLVESTRDGDPLALVVGESGLLPAFEERLVGLETGDKTRIEIPCLDAYGLYEPDNVQVMPREDFPPELSLEPGMLVNFETPGGHEVPGTVVEVGVNEVTVNFSHPLAGHDLVFDIEILEVKPAKSSREPAAT